MYTQIKLYYVDCIQHLGILTKTSSLFFLGQQKNLIPVTENSDINWVMSF